MDALCLQYAGSHATGAFVQALDISSFDVKFTLLGGIGAGAYEISGLMPEDEPITNLNAGDRIDLYVYRDVLTNDYSTGNTILYVRDSTRFAVGDQLALANDSTLFDIIGPIISMTSDSITVETSGLYNWSVGTSVLKFWHRGKIDSLDTNDDLTYVQKWTTTSYFNDFAGVLVNENVDSSTIGASRECGWVLWNTLQTVGASAFLDLNLDSSNFTMSTAASGSPYTLATVAYFDTAQWSAIESSITASLTNITGPGDNMQNMSNTFTAAVSAYTGSEPNGRLFDTEDIASLQSAYLAASGTPPSSYEHGPSTTPFYNQFYTYLQSVFVNTQEITGYLGTGVGYSGTNNYYALTSFFADIITCANGGSVATTPPEWTIDIDQFNVVRFHEVNQNTVTVTLLTNSNTNDNLGDGLYGDCVPAHTTHSDDMTNLFNYVIATGGNDSNGNPIQVEVFDQVSINTWGQREVQLSNTNMNSTTSLTNWATAQLNLTAYPPESFTAEIYPCRSMITCNDYISIGLDSSQTNR